MANHYTDKYSDVRYSQKEIDVKLRQAKAELLENQRDDYGFSFCEKCKEDSLHGIRIPQDDMERKILDCSHIKPISECKKDGEIEKIFSKNNLQVLCRHHHKLYDNLGLKFN